MSDPIHVIGHRNPDTDAICAAIGYAAYLRLEVVKKSFGRRID